MSSLLVEDVPFGISMHAAKQYQISHTFSAKSSRHFESRSSLHVSDLAALTIHY